MLKATPVFINEHTKKIIEPTQKEITRLSLEQHACKLTKAIFGGSIIKGEWIEDYDIMMA